MYSMEEMEWPTEGQGWEGSTEEGSGADMEEEEEESKTTCIGPA